MTTPPKAKKIPRNQPIKFDETLVASLPETPRTDPASSLAGAAQSTLNQARLALWIIWILAAIFAGIGFGRIIIAMRQSADIIAPAAPIAKAKITIATPRGAAILPGHTTAFADLSVVSSSNVVQAQAGTPMSTISVATFQPAASSDAQQPGFDRLTRLQGNTGTASVR